MIESAERSIDAQYYIWHGDTVGNLVFQALRQAADRGVRVRLLLDDINSFGFDASLLALDSHPNIEVRVFNPFGSTHRSEVCDLGGAQSMLPSLLARMDEPLAPATLARPNRFTSV